jgi:hypothetical protein
MRKTFLLLTLASLAGCATSPALDNMASCTLAGDAMLVSSMYGPVGVTSKIRAADAAVACKKPAAAPEAPTADPQSGGPPPRPPK